MGAVTGATRARRVSALLLLSGALCLIAGLWAGLARIGWPVPIDARLVAAHGPLMTVGFFGTVVALERAVASGRPWAFAAPLATASAAVGLGAGMPPALVALLTSAAGIVMLSVFIGLIRQHPSLFLVVSATGALAFAAGGVVWLSGEPTFHVVPWWTAFVLLTVAGERLELTRLLPPSPRARAAFVAVLLAYGAALGSSLIAPEVGARARGLAMIAAAAWLARCDVARRTIRGAGVARYAASCLLLGYAWLAVAGALGASFGDVAVGPRYDAVVHAFFLGFAFSMIFGHAPMVLPAVVGVRVRFDHVLYAPIALLQGALALRGAGDLAGSAAARTIGGLLNALAVLVFLAAMVRATRSKGAPAPSPSAVAPRGTR